MLNHNGRVVLRPHGIFCLVNGSDGVQSPCFRKANPDNFIEKHRLDWNHSFDAKQCTQYIGHRNLSLNQSFKAAYFTPFVMECTGRGVRCISEITWWMSYRVRACECQSWYHEGGCVSLFEKPLPETFELRRMKHSFFWWTTHWYWHKFVLLTKRRCLVSNLSC